MAEKKLTRRESIVREKKEDKRRGVTTKPGQRKGGMAQREPRLKRRGGMAQRGLGRAFKKGGRV